MTPGGYRISLPRSIAGPAPDLPSGAIYSHATMTVWTEEPVISLGGHGCIIGRIFTRELPSRRVEVADPEMVDAIVRTDGRVLLNEYWGGYVLALVGQGNRAIILRDPSGQMSCYFRRGATTVELAADITDLAAPGPMGADYTELARYLASIDAPGRATCATGVEELIAGEAIVVTKGNIDIESWWSPWDYITPPNRRSFAETVEEVRHVAFDCIDSWAGCFGNVLVGVSGGLDSSIVAACARERANLRCLTHVGPDFEGDERRYARALTDHLEMELHEAHYDLAEIDIMRPIAPHHSWPNAPLFRQATEAMQMRACRDGEINAIFSGNGGDGIFCSMRSATPFVDRFLVEGPQISLGETLGDICELTGADTFTVLRHAWRRYRSLDANYPIRWNRLGLAGERLGSLMAAGSRHPWLSVPPDALPGKTAHIAYLMRSHRSLELYPRRRAPPHIAPLLSQPLVELCLSIPTWHWIRGGRDRSVARAAFEDHLPAMVLRRTHKGGPGGFNRSIYDRWKDEIASLLRGGRLVAANIVDPAFLDEPDDPDWRHSDRADRLLSFVAAETWSGWWEVEGVSS